MKWYVMSRPKGQAHFKRVGIDLRKVAHNKDAHLFGFDGTVRALKLLRSFGGLAKCRKQGEFECTLEPQVSKLRKITLPLESREKLFDLMGGGS